FWEALVLKLRRFEKPKEDLMRRLCDPLMLRWGMPLLAITCAVLFQPSGIRAAETSGVGQLPTFTKDVAPILQRSCQNCHRPGSIAPMSLLTYKDARPWARSIKTKVALRQMPP